MGVKVLKTPFSSPQANTHCERLIRGIRRECLDFLIPISEGHLRKILKEWKTHYNPGRAACGAPAQEIARVLGSRHPHAGFMHRCHHRDFYYYQQFSAAASSRPRAKPSRRRS
jgi:hypothetical protein